MIRLSSTQHGSRTPSQVRGISRFIEQTNDHDFNLSVSGLKAKPNDKAVISQNGNHRTGMSVIATGKYLVSVGTYLLLGGLCYRMPERCQGRVPASRYGAEPEKARQTPAHAHLCRGRSMTMGLQTARTRLQSRGDGANTVIPQL